MNKLLGNWSFLPFPPPLAFFFFLAFSAVTAAQCFGKSWSDSLHCSSQMVVIMFLASLDISSETQIMNYTPESQDIELTLNFLPRNKLMMERLRSLMWLRSSGQKSLEIWEKCEQISGKEMMYLKFGSKGYTIFLSYNKSLHFKGYYSSFATKDMPLDTAEHVYLFWAGNSKHIWK